MRREPPYNKFLKDIAGRTSADPDERILKSQAQPIAILGGIIKIRDPTRRQSPDDARVIRLPPPVVAFANY